MAADGSTQREQLETLFQKSDDILLLDLGQAISPPLGVKLPKKDELVSQAKVWLNQKRTYLQDKICADPTVKELLKENLPENLELAIVILDLLIPDIGASKALLVTVLTVRRGVIALCHEE